MSGATEWRLHWGIGLSFVVFFVFSFIAKYFIFIFFYFYFLFFIFYFLFYLFYFYFFIYCLLLFIMHFFSFYCFSMHNHSYLSCIYVKSNVIQTHFFIYIYIRVVSTLR
jgi:hypothetical protein